MIRWQQIVMQNNKKFQVNLEGIISLLSENLYSNKGVFIREVLQNAVDAITARKKIDKDIKEAINFELYDDTLIVDDNGIGLSNEDIEQFLSVIGQSSKRDRDDLLDGDFIGRFGIGLLSCFIVCNEITVITRKVGTDDVYKWIGKNDGTYEIKKLDMKKEYGTSMYLKAKEGCSEYFSFEYILKMLNHYGGFLPYPIMLTYEDKTQNVNENFNLLLTGEFDKTKWNLLGRKVFQDSFLDCIPITSKIAGIKGAAYILKRNTSVAAKVKGKIYVKGMFVSDDCEKLMPSWAFFTKPLINAENLRLTASREDFYEDETLEKVRKEIEKSIRDYFIDLSKSNPKKLEEIINVHYNSLKLMSAEQDELYKIMIRYFKFETTMGKMTLFDILDEYDAIKYTTSVEEYRQIEKIAKAQSICIVNGGYLNDVELIEKFNLLVDRYVTEVVNPGELSNSFDELTFEQMEDSNEFITFADNVLKSHNCKSSIKIFNPKDVPAIYNLNKCTKMLKDINESRDESLKQDNFILAELVSSFEDIFSNEMSDLCFNYSNNLIRKLIHCENKDVKKSVIDIIYVQALMAGHNKISGEEHKLFEEGINTLMDLVL